MTNSDPPSPCGWANFLSRTWGPRFPVDVRTIALEYSKRFLDPIDAVAPAEVDDFEGALFPLKKKSKWAILYNPAIKSQGRINYTLAHELGHYLCHRKLSPAGFRCNPADALGTAQDAQLRDIEHEADRFASYLLMPMDDFRAQVNKSRFDLDLLQHCANRYAVSFTAAALKWLEFTSECAIIVVAVNGFVSWCRRSDSAKKNNVFFERGMAVPENSIAALRSSVTSSDVLLPAGVWCNSPIREIAIYADAYEMTISILVFQDKTLVIPTHEQEHIDDLFDIFQRQ